MVTLLESGLLENFQLVFSLILVVAVVYGVLSLTKVLGDNKGLYAIVALVLGVLVILIPDVSKLINIMAPWFVFFFFFLVFMIIAYKIFGATDGDIASVLKDRAVVWVILIIAILIVIGSFGAVFGQRLLTGENIGPQGPFSDGSTVKVVDGRSDRVVIDARTGEVIRGGRTTPLGRGSVGSQNYAQNLLSTLLHPKVMGMGLIGLIGLFTIAILAMEARM